MNLSNSTFDPHRVVGILIAAGGVLLGAMLFWVSYRFLNRGVGGGGFSIFEMKEIAGLCFGFSTAIVILAYYGCIGE
jgi:hypothetical protein